MKFGLQLTSQQLVGTDQVRALDERLEVLRVVRDAGWNAVFAGQHYLSDDVTHLQPLPYLARLAAEAGDMQVGVGILLLALHNPVEVAESFASLDVVTGGRLIFGVGLGYRQIEYDALGVPTTGKVKRFEANLDIVIRLWLGESVDADLPWCRLDGARLALPPVQRPRPPVWMAANSDPAVRRAARMADAWMANPHATMDTIRRQLKLFHEERQAVGLPPPAELPAMREVFCAKDRDTAVELAARHLADKYRVYAQWGQDKVMPEKESFDMPYSELADQRFIVGSPEDCIRALSPWRDELGINHFVLRTFWAGMPREHAMESVRLIGREVIPALRQGAR